MGAAHCVPHLHGSPGIAGTEYPGPALLDPAHAGVNGNETADQLARQVINLRSQHEYRRPVSTYECKLPRKIEEE